MIQDILARLGGVLFGDHPTTPSDFWIVLIVAVVLSFVFSYVPVRWDIARRTARLRESEMGRAILARGLVPASPWLMPSTALFTLLFTGGAFGTLVVHDRQFTDERVVEQVLAYDGKTVAAAITERRTRATTSGDWTAWEPARIDLKK